MKGNFWREGVTSLPSRAGLDGNDSYDVAIVGGGFSGLWTAYQLLSLQPDLRVAVIEKEHVGFGASGRNGGWFTDNFGVSLDSLVQRYGAEAAKNCIEVLRSGVEEFKEFLRLNDGSSLILGHGIVKVARNEGQLERLAVYASSRERLGLSEGLSRLDQEQLESKVRVTSASMGIYNRHAVVVQPFHVVRLLADVLESMGAVIFEGSKVERIETGGTTRVVTEKGSLQAGNVVVCVEAELGQFSRFSRNVAPLYSMVVLTEPLPRDVWETIGWEGRFGLSSFSHLVDYLSRTPDGRILFGGRGSYGFASRLSPDLERDPRVWHELIEGLNNWFPATVGCEITHQWGGAIGIPRDWLPRYDFDREQGVGVIYGHSGQGMGGSFLAGKVMAGSILGADDPWRGLPMVTTPGIRWEPEPLRWVGVNMVRRALYSADRRDGKPSAVRDWLSPGMHFAKN